MGCLFYFGRTQVEQEDLSRQGQSRLNPFASGRDRLLRKLPGTTVQNLIANPNWLKRAVYTLTRSSERQAWISPIEVEKEVRAAEAGRSPHPDGVAFVEAFLRVELQSKFAKTLLDDLRFGSANRQLFIENIRATLR